MEDMLHDYLEKGLDPVPLALLIILGGVLLVWGMVLLAREQGEYMRKGFALAGAGSGILVISLLPGIV